MIKNDEKIDYDRKNYQEVEEYILSIPKFAKKNTVADSRQFYQSLRSPGSELKIIHVAGTNGKGSVCSYLSNLLLQSGYHVGVFTSPHLISMRERFCIDGEMIGEEEFVEVFQAVMDKAKDQKHPTFFELLFFMGMLWFQKRKPEYILLETGLGGRLDATNLIENPTLTVLTQIGLDHMEYLGDTIEEIAFEKAGIIKKGVPVVYADNRAEVSKIIRERALQMAAHAYPISKQMLKNYKMKNKKIDFSFKSRYYDYVSLTISTQALYQIENVMLAILAFEILEEKGKITLEQMQNTIQQAKWPGRMEEILENVWLDGAHNQDGIKAFLTSVKETNRNKNLLLFSAVKEKEYPAMIQSLAESKLFSEIIVTELTSERKADVQSMQNLFAQYTKETPVIAVSNSKEAFALCREKQRENTSLYIVGSLYLVGMMKEIIELDRWESKYD